MQLVVFSFVTKLKACKLYILLSEPLVVLLKHLLGGRSRVATNEFRIIQNWEKKSITLLTLFHLKCTTRGFLTLMVWGFWMQLECGVHFAHSLQVTKKNCENIFLFSKSLSLGKVKVETSRPILQGKIAIFKNPRTFRVTSSKNRKGFIEMSIQKLAV